MDKNVLQRLNKLSDSLQKLYEPIDIYRYTAPINRITEKQRLFTSHEAGEVYNPQFSYQTLPSDWDKPLHQFLTELHRNENEWEQLIYLDVSLTLDLMRGVTNRDTGLITEATINFYGQPTEELTQSAYQEIASLSPKAELSTISARDMVEQMNNALSKASLVDWQVIVNENMNARMSVRSEIKQVNVNAAALFTTSELKRLLIHEIGTHVFRSVNGNLQPLRLLQFGLYNYMATEEGLASYHEVLYGVQSAEDQLRYALRVIAAYMSLNHSFYEVFCELTKHTSKDEAFDIVTRAKRGFVDTSKHGCHVKDKVYFEGFHQVSSHLEKYPNDYSLLMSGKVSLSILPALRELRETGYLLEPQYLPEQLILITAQRDTL
jgi:uncharacterized protein (TIGR02421 family)